MEKTSTSFKSIFLVCAFAFCGLSLVLAQEEIVVDNGSDLYTVISDLMDEDGMLSTNVFVLQREAVYFMSQTIITNDDIILKGEEGDEAIPAMVIPRAAPDGNYVVTWFITEGIGKTFTATDVIFQMLTLTAMETGINVNVLVDAKAENQRIILDRCIVNGNGNNTIQSSGDGQYIKVTNCKFRNNRNLSDDWSGGVLYGNWSSGGWRDSLIFRNNTLVNIGNTALRCFTGETSRAIIIDHNTFFGSTRPACNTWAQSNVQVTNNMFVASHASGNPKSGGSAPDIDIWGKVVAEDFYHKGSMYYIGLLDAAAYPHVESVLGYDVSGDQESIEEQRTFVIKNNCTYWPSELIAAWDTIDEDGGAVVPTFRTDDQVEWIFEHIILNDDYDNSYGHEGSPDALTSDFDPGFDPATVKRILDPMNTWIDGFRNEEGWTPFMANIDDPGKEIQLQWPLPENLAYTNEVLKTGGTDGLPVGDLNWFPTSTSSKDGFETTDEISLSNFPNPFSNHTTITYQLMRRAPVKLTVFNMIGEAVFVLVNQFQEAGAQHVEWSGIDASGNELPAGMYIYSIEAGSSSAYSKMIINR